MKAKIHPVFHTNTKVSCSCGKSFITGSTFQTIDIESCSLCHPFYTGKQKTHKTGQVDKFKKKLEKSATKKTTAKNKKVKRAEKDSRQNTTSEK